MGTLLWWLGASGCPPAQPIPGRAASLPLPANSLDGISGPRRADRAARTPLRRLGGLRVATATATSGSRGSAKSARPVRGRAREPLPDSLLGRTCCQGSGGRPGSPRNVASPASGSAFEPWAPPRALRRRFSVALGNSHFRERVPFSPRPPSPRPDRVYLLLLATATSGRRCSFPQSPRPVPAPRALEPRVPASRQPLVGDFRRPPWFCCM